jgi:UDP-N-acetylmuramate--alanine ligase
MKKKQAFLIGIKGVAMTSLAVYLKEKGYQVTGSDVAAEFLTDNVLREYRIPVRTGFSPDNIDKNSGLVVVTGAHGGMTNPQAVKAKELNLPVFMHGEYLGKLMENSFGISVAGCHGKTTSSAMVAYILSKAGYDPSYLIGTSGIHGLGACGHYGKSKYFVAEADEYMTCPKTCPTPRFLWHHPTIAIITNIDYDHPDAYKNISEVRRAYLSFVEKLPRDGLLIACIDDPNVQKILPEVKREVLTYGFSPAADFHITNARFGDGVSFFSVKNAKMEITQIMLRVPGRHNMLNGLASALAANRVGLSWATIRKHLATFTGTTRRFEKKGEAGGILLYDDYAHHPSEISATISAARNWFPERRLVTVFQPHTYSRTKALFSDFARAFSQANVAVITDIYSSAREQVDPSVSISDLVIAINREKKNAVYKADKKAVISLLEQILTQGDLVLTMGAGDIVSWHSDILSAIKKYG